jgi:hypothetical protein
MPYKIVFTPAASRDLQKAMDWEEDRSNGLGKNSSGQKIFCHGAKDLKLEEK